jgi:hypothetical protein
MKLIALSIAVLTLAGCTDSMRSKWGGLGNSFKVEMYSGGQLVRSWVSTGKVLSETNSDGYYFKDKETGKLVEVAGDVVITEQ